MQFLATLTSKSLEIELNILRLVEWEKRLKDTELQAALTLEV